MRTIIEAECRDQELTATASPLLASGGKHEDFVRFSFCEKWNGLKKTGVFYRDAKVPKPYYSEIDSAGLCEIPHEVTDTHGIIYFGVFGMLGDVTRTSSMIKYKVHLGAISSNLEPTDPTPEIWEKLLQQYNEILDNQTEFITAQEQEMERFEEEMRGVVHDIAHTTDKTLLGSSAGGIKLIGLHGKSEQRQYSGKNLLPYPYVNTTKTVNGVSYTDNGDGTVTANGTSTANTAFDFTSQMLVEAGTYTFSIGTTLPEKAICYAYDIANSKAYAQLYLNNTSATFTITEPTYISFYIVVSTSGAKYSNVVLKPQLELGEVATNFEPYVGGKPSPSPDYPQSIKPVEVSEIKSVGKNRLNNIVTSKTVGELTITVNNDKSITVVGTTTKLTEFPITDYLELEDNTEYILSGCPIGGANTTYDLRIWSNNTAKFKVREVGEGARFTTDITNDINYKVYITVTQGQTMNHTFYPMIRRADIEDDTYEPYTESVVKLSKPITLNGIGESADELTPSEKNKRFATVEYDGSSDENWVAQIGSNALTSYLYIQNPTQKANGEVLGSHFISGRSDGAEGHIWLGGTVLCLNLFNGFTTADELKGWLAENPITVTYELAESITEALPEADQIALHGLKSFNGVTHISTDSEVEATIEMLYGTSKVGALALENAELHAVNEILMEQLSADVEGCLPKKGGVVDEILYVGSTGATTAETVAIQNNKRKMLNQVTADGRYVLYDNTNGKAVIDSSARGATTFYGTANNAIADANGNNIANTYVAKTDFTVEGDTLILNWL